MLGASIFVIGELVLLGIVTLLAGYFHHEQGGGQSSQMLTFFGAVFVGLSTVWALICFVWS